MLLNVCTHCCYSYCFVSLWASLKVINVSGFKSNILCTQLFAVLFSFPNHCWLWMKKAPVVPITQDSKASQTIFVSILQILYYSEHTLQYNSFLSEGPHLSTMWFILLNKLLRESFHSTLLVCCIRPVVIVHLNYCKWHFHLNESWHIILNYGPCDL